MPTWLKIVLGVSLSAAIGVTGYQIGKHSRKVNNIINSKLPKSKKTKAKKKAKAKKKSK